MAKSNIQTFDVYYPSRRFGIVRDCTAITRFSLIILYKDVLVGATKGPPKKSGGPVVSYCPDMQGVGHFVGSVGVAP